MASREENLRYLAGGSLPKDTGAANGSSITGTKEVQTDGLSEKARRREENLRYLATPAEDITPKNETVENSSFTSKSGKFDASAAAPTADYTQQRAKLQKELDRLDNAAAYVTTTEQSDEIDAQRKPIIEQLRKLDEAEGKTGVYTGGDRLKNALGNAKLATQQGLTQADHRIAQTADWLFGGIAKEGKALVNATLQTINPNWGFEDEDPWITRYNKRGAEVLAQNDAIAQQRIEEGRLNKTAWKYAPEVVAAIPDAVLAFATGGASAGGQATRAGLETASAIAQGSSAAQKLIPIADATKNMMKSPAWMSAFAQTAGGSYEEALADGATEEQASLYALLNGFANATIEVGGTDEAMGGIQKLPQQLRDALEKGNKNAVMQWVKSTAGEAKEEVLQGMAEKGLRGLYTNDVPLYSETDENAVINPKRAKEEALGGLIVGGVLGGGQTALQSAINIGRGQNANGAQDAQETQTAAGDISAPPTQENADRGASARLNSDVQTDVGLQNAEGIKNTAPNGAESTVVNTDPARHTAAEQSVIDEYQAAVDDNLVNYIETVRDNAGAKIGRYSLKRVNDRAAQDIKRLTGVDTTGNKTVIEPRIVEHILKRHGENGSADSSMRDINDIARIQYVLDNYDDVSYGGKSGAYRTVKPNGRAGQADTVIFSKAVNGTYYVVEATPDTKAKTVFVTSAYMSKKNAASRAAKGAGGSRVANAEASRSTSETSGANSPAINAEDVQTADANAWRGTSETKNALSPAAEADASKANIAPDAQNVNPNVPAQTVEESGGKKRSQTEAHTLQTIDERLDTPAAEREELYYIPKSESESLREAAERIREDMPGARAELAAKDMWSGTDHDTAMGILGSLNREAAQTGNYDDFRAWRRTIQEHGTDTARALQSLAKYTRTGTGAMMDAVDIIDSSNISGELKSALTAEVGRYSEEYDAARAKAENGNLADMADLIERMARRRNTWTFGKNRYSKIVRELASDKSNAEWLTDYAYRQISAIASDAAVKVPFSQKVKSAQTTAQLTSIGTFLRNIGGNVTFGVQDTLSQNGVALAIDRLISQATGKRTVGADKSWFSSEARKGARDAMQKSILEVAGDIDMNGNENRYGMTSSRSWRMSGNAAERFMSRWQQLLGYSLTTSDRFSRGAIEAEITRGLDALGNSGLTAEEKAAIAKQTADYRLFQNHGEAYTASKAIHDFLNVAGFGGTRNGATRQGGFGLGDVVNPYPGVPANLGVKALEYSPANVIKGGAEIIKVLKDTKNGKLDAAKQHQAVMDVSRGVTGTAMVALMAALFKAGFIRNSDDEDDLDAKARNAERGLSGVQINADAALDWLSGKPKREWREGDTLVSVDWMEPLNAFMAIGSLIANDTDADLGSYAVDYAEGAFQALMDIPVMSNLKSLDDTIRYSNSDNWSEALGEGLAEYGTNTATGFIPAPFRQIAKALDPYYRDTSADTAGQKALNKVKNAIPGLRQTLDPKLGATGELKKYNEGGLQHMLNSLFLPGSISTLGGSETDTELEKLYKATGMENIYQDRKAPKSVSLAGEKYELTNDEKRSYLQTQGQATERTLKNFMDSELYGMMTDKEKAQTIAAINEYGREEAKAELFKNRGIERESGNEGLSDVKNVGEYLGAKTAFTQAKKQNDYSAQDKFLKVYDQLTAGTKRMLENSSATARMDDMAEAYEKGGIRAKEWNTVYEKYKELNGTKRSGYTASDKATDFEAWMEREGFTQDQRKMLADQFTFFSQVPGDAGRYNSLKDAGFDTDSAYAIYDKVSSLTAPTGEKTVKDWQKLEAINSLDLTGEEKIKALSVYYPPNDDGKEDAMVRRYKAAEEQGISFATWTKAMKIIAGADGTSRKAIFAAVQEAGYTETDAQIIYDIWKHS
jgi:hypothetical protein